MALPIIYDIAKTDKEGFRSIIKSYFQFYENLSETISLEKSEEAYDYIIRGLDFDGKTLVGPVYFEERLAILTKDFYTAPKKPTHKIIKIKRPKKKDKAELEVIHIELEAIKKIKKNLVSEYPHLNRRDLETQVDNYVILTLKINKLLSGGIAEHNTAIKNMVDALVRFGSFLGIDESTKQKQKQLEDRQSIAALSLQFENTMSEFPELMQRLRLQEMRMLLEKYERQEITREVFALDSYAGLSVEEARVQIKDFKKKSG